MTYIQCPNTGKYYERWNNNAYHCDDCPYCAGKEHPASVGDYETVEK